MKDKSKLVFTLSVVLALVLGIGIGGYAASGYGSQSDPLVTLSYLTDELTPQIMDQVQDMIDQKAGELGGEAPSGAGETYRLLTLTSGQRVVGGVGCEILLRVGTAECVADDSPGLVDLSSTGSINSGDTLETNHLYMVTIEGHGFEATAQTVKILVRGDYTVE